VRTRLDPDDRLLQATSLTISVRCYEHRIGRVNVQHSNVLVNYTETLWSKSDDVESESIGNLDYPFRLTLPVSVEGFSTAVFVDYRCVWRVEAGVYFITFCYYMRRMIDRNLSSQPCAHSWCWLSPGQAFRTPAGAIRSASSHTSALSA